MKLQSTAFTTILTSLLFILTSCSDTDRLDANRQDPPSYFDQQGGGDTSVCAASGVSPVGIIGGQVLDKNSWLTRGVVFIAQEFKVNGEERQSICTGSLIDSNLILTAAHCVDRSKENFGRTLSVYFSHQPDCDRKMQVLATKKRQVTAVRIHPNWNPTSTSLTDRGDIALIRIAGKAPSPYQPLKLTSEFLPIPHEFPVLLAGYGMLNPDYFGSFGGPISLRVGQAPPITPVERDYLLQLNDLGGYTTEFDNTAANEMFYIDQSRGQGICAGDSGGPSLYKNNAGKFVITGVASFVMNPEDQRLLCGYVAAHTSVSFHRAWLESNFQELRNDSSTVTTLFE